ncbi:DUF4136 domain-containing protein [Rhodocytophaga aerolata]
MNCVNLFLLAIALFMASCSGNSYKVNGVSNANANMDENTTFGFASQVDKRLNPDPLFSNDLVLKSEIRDAVTHEMESRGFTKDKSSPDLVVNFRVFEEATQIQGLEGLGDNYWADTEIVDVDNPETVNLKEGSLMIHIVDRNTGKLIWQGYASGLMDGEVFGKDKNKITEAVSMVFDTYNQRADNL